MTIPLEKHAFETVPATAPDPPDCDCDRPCEDCRRALVLEELRQFAADTRRAELERAKRELAATSDGDDEHEWLLERVATVLTWRLLDLPALRLCRDDDVDDATLVAALELFERESEIATACRDASLETGATPQQTNCRAESANSEDES